MLILLDIGNSSIKAGLIDLKSESFVSINSFKKIDSLFRHIKNIEKNYQIKYLVYSSVRAKETEDIIKNLRKILGKKVYVDQVKYIDKLQNEESKIFYFFYDPITSYGNDRLSLLYYIAEKYPKDTILAIDSGTALTIDTMHALQYEGGSIFPGVNLALKSLFLRTRQLPLLKVKDINDKNKIKKIKYEFFGFSTKDSILSGIYNSFSGFIIHSYTLFAEKIEKKYQIKNPEIKILLTGGDSHLIYELIKDNFTDVEIIIEENAVLLGLQSYIKFKIKNSII